MPTNCGTYLFGPFGGKKSRPEIQYAGKLPFVRFFSVGGNHDLASTSISSVSIKVTNG
jgi:hypothetical protein